jgi:nitrite reductase/ring-hydroxylating ferredoxin subunit
MSKPLDPPDGPGKCSGNDGKGVNRRDFLNEITAAALGITGLGGAVVTLNYISPNVLFEPPARFRIGPPEDYPVNSVNFLREQQVFIVRTVNGFFAVSAICTHLGCITEWKPDDNLIECPCHGSRYTREGTKVAGPAPRSLPHFNIQLGPDGQLVVDKMNTIPESQILRV